MNIGKIYNRAEQKAADLVVCVLIALCLCLPAQSQIVKIPFLGLACVIGLIRLLQSRGQAITKATWIWYGIYLVYNLIWSVFGIVRGYAGASNYFRLGVIWPIAFFLLTACFGKNTLKWVARTMFLVVALQVIAVFILIGYALQLWPNILQWIYPKAAVGIHPGYLHVVGHFIGGMAFSVPFVYSYMVLNRKTKPVWQLLFLPAWFLVMLALVSTSRRILLVVLIVCTVAVIVVPLLRRVDRRKLLLRSVIGFAVTCVFLWAAISLVSNISNSFLRNHYDAVLKVIHNESAEQDDIRYTGNLVFDLEGVVPPGKDGLTDDPNQTNPNDPNHTNPTDPDKDDTPGISGFKDRVDGLIGEMGGENVRSYILTSVLENWTDSPIVGVGFGAPLPGYESSGDGIYEMEYVVRLYTSGLLGLAILLALMLYVGIAPLKHISRYGEDMTTLAPCTVAYLGAVVATLSNPYIFSGFDYLLMLFLPVAFLNSIRKNKETGKEC